MLPMCHDKPPLILSFPPINTDMGNKVTELDCYLSIISHDCMNAFCNHDKLFLHVRKRTQVKQDILVIIVSPALPFNMLHCP